MKFKLEIIVETEDKRFEEDENLMEDIVEQVLNDTKVVNLKVKSSYGLQIYE